MFKDRRKYHVNDNNLAVAYYRYSSHSQNAASIEEQRSEAQRYALEHGYTIVREYVDSAKTGTIARKRPEFNRMCDELPSLKVALLLVWKRDRLSRNESDFVKLDEAMLNAGTRYYFIKDINPENNAAGVFAEFMSKAQAIYYSLNLSENIIVGNNKNAEKSNSNGHKIFGYLRGPDKKYIEDPDTSWVVPRIFNEYASGKSLQRIADSLNNQGFHTVRGGKFNIENLRKILHNDRYTGVYRYGDFVNPGGMPQLVSQELFDRVQKQFAENKRQSSHKDAEYDDFSEEAPRFWLTGKLFCAKCQSSMHGIDGNKNGKRYYYYACKEHRNHRCTKKNVRKEKIESEVTDLLYFLLNTEDNCLQLIEDSIKAYEASRKDNHDLIRMEERQKNIEKELNRLVDFIKKFDNAPETIMDSILELEAEKKHLVQSIQLEKLKAGQLKDMDLGEMYRKYLNANLSDPAIREELLDYFVDKIYIDDDGRLSFILKLRSKYGVELRPMTPDEIIDYSGFTRFDTFVNSSTTTLEAEASRVFFCL